MKFQTPGAKARADQRAYVSKVGIVTIGIILVPLVLAFGLTCLVCWVCIRFISRKAAKSVLRDDLGTNQFGLRA